MARPAITLILVTRQTVLRADLTGRGAPAADQVWAHARPETPDIVAAVDFALSLGPKVGSRVYVLSSDFWLQCPTLSAAKASGLLAADLGMALNFEVEGRSGIPAADGTAAAVTLPPVRGEVPCWTVQIRSGERDAIADAVRRAGSTFGGVTHPAAVPEPLRGQAGVAFQRIELWPDAVVGVRRDATGRLQMKVINTDPPLGRWGSEMGAWLEPGPTELLTADNLAATGAFSAPGTQTPIPLSDPVIAGEWVARWAAALTARAPQVPVVGPAPRVASGANRGLAAGVLVILAAAACIGLRYFIDQQQTRLNASLAGTAPDGKGAETIRAELKAETEKRDRGRADRAKLEKVTPLIEQHRARYSKLLEALATHMPENVVVQKIDHDASGPKVSGVTLRPELAQQYTRTLYAPLKAFGWEVQPAKETALKERDAWGFEFVVRDVSAPSTARKN